MTKRMNLHYETDYDYDYTLTDPVFEEKDVKEEDDSIVAFFDNPKSEDDTNN